MEIRKPKMHACSDHNQNDLKKIAFNNGLTRSFDPMYMANGVLKAMYKRA